MTIMRDRSKCLEITSAFKGKQVSPSTQRVMRQIFDFVKTTVLGGAIFLLPFAATLLVVVKAGKMAVDSVTPLAEKLPFPKGEVVIAVYVVGASLLVLVAFAAGLLARSRSRPPTPCYPWTRGFLKRRAGNPERGCYQPLFPCCAAGMHSTAKRARS
jgi:hypothetical protein